MDREDGETTCRLCAQGVTLYVMVYRSCQEFELELCWVFFEEGAHCKSVILIFAFCYCSLKKYVYPQLNIAEAVVIQSTSQIFHHSAICP